MPINVTAKLKDANYEGEWQSCDLMGESARNYRAPFKVYQALWNPSIDLVALASKKGEICVRRYFWKRGWKRDVFDAKSLLDERTQQQGDTRLQTMCWSPNGKFLAAALHDGSIHLLDTEKGFIRYSIKLKDKICLMKWYSLPYKSPKIDNDQVAGIVGEMTTSHPAAEKSSEKPTENDYLKNLKEFCEIESFENIIGTVMICADEERIVHILAAGLLPIARIEPPSKYFVNSDPYSISIGDLIYSSRNERLYVVYSSMAQADTSDVKTGCDQQPSFGINTQIIDFDINAVDCFKNGSVWRTAYRWLHLYYSLSYISDTFSRMIVDWDEQSSAFESAFDSFNNSNSTNSSSSNDISSPSLADCLLNIILNGHSNANLLSFFRNSFAASDCKKMNEWINKGFTQLIETLNGDLYCAAQMFQHHMKQFVWEFECVTSKWKSTQFLPNRVFDVSVYPYGSYLLEEDRDESELNSGLEGSINACEMLTLKVVELSIVALKNRKDLSNFMQWLSQTPWLSSRTKSSSSSHSSSSKVDLDAVLEYITQTLGASKTPLVTNYNKEESPGLVEQMDEIFKPAATEAYVTAMDTSSNSSLHHDDSSKNIVSNSKNNENNNANSVFAEAIVADNECEMEKNRSKPHYSFDKVKQYLNRFDRLKHPIDVSNNEWRTPELTSLQMNDNRNTTLTLAQCISECIACLDKIRSSLLSKFSPTIQTKSNVFVEMLHSEGFERFNFFSLHSSADEYENDEAKEYMENLSRTESIGISCIGSEGRRHHIYTSSGNVISQVKYIQQEDSLTNNAKMSSSTRSVSSKGSSVRSYRGERRRSSSDNNLVAATTTAAAINQPLQIDVLSEIPSSKIYGGNCLAVVKNRRIIQFEWLDGGIYYALMKVKRNQDEYVHLTRAFIGDKTVWAHEDTSCIEHYSSFSLSAARKLGLTLSECGTRVRWFEIGSCVEEHNDEEPETSDSVFANQINETKENINTSPTLNNEETSKEANLFGERNPRGKQNNEENVPDALNQLPSTTQLRRSSRKRKSQRD